MLLALLIAASLQADVDRIAAEVLRDAPAQGASVAVLRDGRTVVSRDYGHAEKTWRFGSATKQFTAAATLLLVQRGKLRLDQPVTELVPAFPHREVLVRH